MKTRYNRTNYALSESRFNNYTSVCVGLVVDRTTATIT